MSSIPEEAVAQEEGDVTLYQFDRRVKMSFRKGHIARDRVCPSQIHARREA